MFFNNKVWIFVCSDNIMEEDQTKLDFVIETLVEKIENEIVAYREERKKVD